MSAFCRDCNLMIDESKETSEGRRPCSKCGSRKRRYEESLSDSLAIGALTRTKGYVGGLSRKKGIRFESKDGDSFSVSLGRFVKLNQLVDHDADRYIKKVVVQVTGELLREVDEPLSCHQDLGSARKSAHNKSSIKKMTG